ncbi:MAG: PadR family transcriptional regulator [Anaerolineae bacterium]|nr:PadR family transcriptional regulator [Anaerolineae bacterium]
MNFRGSLTLLILYVLSKGPNHGYQIAKAIKQQSQGILDFKEGTLYPTLHGLEGQGMIQAFEQAENGRTRRYYRLTQDGRALLEEELDEWSRYSSAVNDILKGAQLS